MKTDFAFAAKRLQGTMNADELAQHLENYRRGVRWAMHDATLAELRGLRAGGGDRDPAFVEGALAAWSAIAAQL